MDKLYWTLLESGAWKMYLAATGKGLCYIGSPNAPFQELLEWTGKKLPGVEPLRDDEALAGYAVAIRAYLEEGRRGIDVPLDLRGTDFQRTVWQELLRIPHGTVCAYSDIAERIGRTTAVRAVGAAIGANPVLIFVPCHRVLGKNGKLTGFRGGMEMKAELLRLEGAH